MYKIFVIMPFDEESKDLYEHMKEVINNKHDNVEIYRADDLLNQQNILKDIVESIYTANLIIADLTSLNPNVFYELGLAHAFKKDVILLTQDVDELPFDLRSYRVIPYSLHFKKIESFTSSLLNTIEESIAGTCTYSNPVTDFIAFKEIKGEESLQDDRSEDVTVTNPLEIDEDGMLDYIADMEESVGILSNIISDLGGFTGEVTEKTTLATNKISKAQGNMSAGTAAFVRKEARKLSIPIIEYVERLDQINHKYEENWGILDKALANVIKNKNKIISNSGDMEFDDFIEGIEYLKNAISNSLGSIDGMIQGANSVKGLERNLTRGITDMIERLNKLLDLLKMSESSLERAITFGKLIILK